MKTRTIALIMLAGSVTAPAFAQESRLAAARELYASARYDEALAVLNGLRPANPSNPVELRSVEQYRSLCLLALGRGVEAEAAIAAVVAADPFYQPSESEASPRVRAAFSEVRQRQLPAIAQARYAAAKEAFDRKEHAEAERQFRELLRLVDDPDMGGRLSDLRLLAAGFLDLTAAAIAAAEAAPPPEPVRAEPPTPEVPKAPPADHVFTADDAGVVPPVMMRQEVPRVPTAIVNQTRGRGILELTIDEQGRVIALNLRVSLHPLYDPQLLSAARDWRYRPATYEGKPVKFRKMVQITVDKRQ
ncbi:MAG TPA: energy transducer TonB [Vicinamibacterales bacterium]|nr:energy transducer TonB [Vicinamibacterales bacterium]